MLKVEEDTLPCLVIGNYEYWTEYDKIIGLYSDAQEMLLLKIKDNIYKLDFEDENKIQNPRYFKYNNDISYFIECNKNGKYVNRMNKYCILNLHFTREIKIPRISYKFKKLLNIDNEILQKEINRLQIDYDKVNKDNKLMNIEIIQHYWQQLIYVRFTNENYKYNGAIRKYYNLIESDLIK
jgi:hypothetical protein